MQILKEHEEYLTHSKAYPREVLTIDTEKRTISYYNNHAKQFVDDTQSTDLHEIQDLFLQLLPPHALILDLGCGSGRDMKYFLQQGFMVEGIDGSVEMCRAASAYTGVAVRNMLFNELQEADEYDAVWACASILHVPQSELQDIFQRIMIALKSEGIFYTSFKYGNFEGYKDERYFTYMNEQTMQALISSFPEFQIEKMWLSSDARHDREAEKWLNIIVRKIS